MKLRITLKQPDVISDALDRLEEHLDDEQREQIEKLCKRWVQYGEIVTLEIDVEKETCVIVPCGRGT